MAQGENTKIQKEKEKRHHKVRNPKYKKKKGLAQGLGEDKKPNSHSPKKNNDKKIGKMRGYGV